MRKNTKINRHEKVAAVLLSGKPVSPDEIKACFAGTDQENVLYRLPTNIHNIRKDGGIIRVHKEGRRVIAYQLVNVDEFNKDGRYIGKPKAEQPTQVTQPVETPVAQEQQVAETV